MRSRSGSVRPAIRAVSPSFLLPGSVCSIRIAEQSLISGKVQSQKSSPAITEPFPLSGSWSSKTVLKHTISRSVRCRTLSARRQAGMTDTLPRPDSAFSWIPAWKGLNSISKDESLVRLVTIEGEEYLRYHLPAPTIALIKATSVDANGNVSFENEYCSVDALSLAQLTRRANGKVIVQVDRLRSDFRRPRDVILPAALVDIIVVCPQERNDELFGTLSGDIHVPLTHMQYWYARLEEENAKIGYERDDLPSSIIGSRAADELRPGDIVNIGIGIPEKAAKYAAVKGILQSLTLSVESGGMGGLPAGGRQFGAMIGAGSISDMSMQFDFYDGGGLDRCFMGALEIDRHGNVNAHRSADHYAGVGGFCNITAATENVVFCFTFSAKGLEVSQKDGLIRIEKEGKIPKIVEHVRSISFSGRKAVENRQNVLYITERCVFALRPEGLALIEVYPGIDKQKDILEKLPFAVADETAAQQDLSD